MLLRQRRKILNSGAYLKNMEKKELEKITIRDKKKYAKTGMTVSMGALVVTGFMQGKGPKALHVWAGAALIGFSLWHHMLSKPKTKR